MQRLRILHLLSGTGPAGSSRSVAMLAAGLAKRGHSVMVGCSPNTYNYSLMKEKGINVIPLRMANRFDLESAKKIVELSKERKLHIINSHLSADRYLALFAKIFGASGKVVLTRRVLSLSTRLESWFYAQFADKIIAVSEQVKESLVRDGIPKEKIVVVYNGIPLEDFDRPDERKIRELRERYHIPPGEKVLGAVARLAKEKGHGVLLRALRRVDCDDYKLLILGEKCEHQWLLDEIKSLGLSNKVELCGFHQDIAPFYHLFDIKILPSTADGFPLSLLEAMASDTPVIGCRAGGGISELIKDGVNGFLFSKDNDYELANKINILLTNNTLRQRLIKAGKETVKRFSIEDTVDRVERAYYELAGG